MSDEKLCTPIPHTGLSSLAENVPNILARYIQELYLFFFRIYSVPSVCYRTCQSVISAAKMNIRSKARDRIPVLWTCWTLENPGDR